MNPVRAMLLAVLLCLAGCGYRDEIASSTSPDGQIVATLSFESSGGATLPGYHTLYLSGSSDQDKFAHRVVLGYRLNVSKLEWHDDVLAVSYTEGNIYEFASSWRADSDRKIEVRLSPDCGGGLCVTRLIGPPMSAPSTNAREQVLSVTSPNGNFTALLTRETAGSAKEPLYRLRIVSGAETEEEKWATMVLEAKDLKAPVLSWDGPLPILEVSYAGGEIVKFQNVWQDGAAYRAGQGEYRIEIRLVPRCEGMCF